MSFIIKGFDTDGNCLHCYFQSEDSDRCILTDDDIPLYGKGHPDSCPLVPLPEGHGRLGDLDALSKEFEHRASLDWNQKAAPYSWAYAYSEAQEAVDDSPTIVPAEGGGEDGN